MGVSQTKKIFFLRGLSRANVYAIGYWRGMFFANSILTSKEINYVTACRYGQLEINVKVRPY